MLINSSEDRAACFVETKNLDGETNLKFKSGSEDLIELVDLKTREKLPTKTDEDVLKNVIGLEIHCDRHATESLENFRGTIQ